MNPSGRIEPQPWMTTPEAGRVLGALTKGGEVARFVGGCVRDAVLGRPAKDVDIATGLPPEAVMARLAEAGIKAVPTGLSHGTVTAVVGTAHYEITTLRHDVETYGRRAKVAFTDDWMADAARRDFTINAMFASADGTLYDPFGGREDLAQGRVRFVGKAQDRIREDVLRLLRFYRFYAHYGRGEPDPEGVAAARALASLLPTLSSERVAGELLRLLGAHAPAAVLELMDEHGVLAHILPEALRFARLSALVAIETGRGPVDPLRRLAAVLQVDADDAEAAARRLRLSNAERARLVSMADGTPRPTPALGEKQGRRLLYRFGRVLFEDLALLAWAEAGAAAPGFGAWLDRLMAWTQPTLPVRGADVLKLGIAPGARVQALLDAVESWWIDGGFEADRAACLHELELRVRSP